MRVIARRWALRHEPRVYGPQQARKLGNALTRDQGIPSAAALLQLFFCLKSRESKGRVRRVPIDAVLPNDQIASSTSRRGNTRGPSGAHYY